ncbi:MAG: alpha/beta hydrolase [Candidatus Aenigmarchaeota archaeon]|nr:alpha/beta hydrolase [Candidatus Aenigmarchaeota archaeon]
MSHESDLSFLNEPRLQFVFIPRKDVNKTTDYFIEVEKGIKIGCRFYVKSKNNPSFLYFHGNGEIVSDYDEIAPLYNERGINLFVADYRGYGFSDGEPTIINMIRDSHIIFKGFKEIIEREGYKKYIFTMGRSIGNIPSIELAYHYQGELSGLIVESGSANTFSRLFNYVGLPLPVEKSILEKIEETSSKKKIQSISIPTLIIHGEYDDLVPLSEGLELYENSGAEYKNSIIIPNADHNSLIFLGKDLYFSAVEEFVKTVEERKWKTL